jgi:thioredoxin 1
MFVKFATEATFARQVLRAPLPVLALFGLRSCPARRAMQPRLAQIVASHGDRLLLRVALIDDAALLAEQYAVSASPTLIIFQHGEPQGRAVGFLPTGLLQLLIEEVLTDGLNGHDFWSPVEEALEDLVLIPLLQSWGFSVRRQVSCLIGKARRGRIDLLVYEGEQLLTLIESKRHLRSEWELQQAVRQTQAYAQALDLRFFVVAAPAGLWLYRCDGENNHLVRYFTSLELDRDPQPTLQFLRAFLPLR